jgi:hypothetical protein
MRKILFGLGPQPLSVNVLRGLFTLALCALVTWLIGGNYMVLWYIGLGTGIAIALRHGFGAIRRKTP